MMPAAIAAAVRPSALPQVVHRAVLRTSVLAYHSSGAAASSVPCRGSALVAVFVSTGLRFRSVAEEVTRSGLDPVARGMAGRSPGCV
jgi:hypothetical protein